MRKIVICLIVFFLAINILTLDGSLNWGDDFSGYIGQAKALAEGRMGEFVSISNYRVSNSEIQVGPNLYPWGYPLILTPAIALFGVEIVLLKIITYVFFIALLFLLYRMFEDELSKNISLLLVLVIASSPYFFDFKQNIISDVPATFFSLLTLLLIQKLYLGNIKERSKNIYLILLGLSIFASIFIRTSSAVLIMLLLAVQTIEHKKWYKGFSDIVRNSVPFLVFAGIYFPMLFFFPASSYANHFIFDPRLVLGLIAKNFYFYLFAISDLFGNAKNMPSFLGPGNAIILKIVYAISLLFFLLGFLKNFKKYYLYSLFFLFSVGLLLIYPYSQGLRLVIPVIPFFLFFAILGIRAVDFKKIFNVDSKNIVYAAAFLLLLLFSIQIFPAIGNSSSEDGPYAKSSEELFHFIKENTSTAETVSFFKPRVMYLFTNRKAVYVGSIEFLKDANLDYYTYTKGADADRTKSYLDQNGKLIFSNDQFQVYDLRKI